MSYNRHIGVENESITSQKLNTIENAVDEANSAPASAATPVVVIASKESGSEDVFTYILDKTGNEIYNHIMSGDHVVIAANYPNPIPGEYMFTSPVLGMDEYFSNSYFSWAIVCAMNPYYNFSSEWLVEDSADDYPITAICTEHVG